MIKNSIRILLALLLIFSFYGCTSMSTKSENLISKGDYVGAIQLLSERLTKKPKDKDSMALFKTIYPSYPEKLISSNVDLEAAAPTDPDKAVQLVENYENLVQIQRATMSMPANLLDGTEVKKYQDNFDGKMVKAKATAAKAFYLAADQKYPGKSRSDKEEILNLLAGVRKYDPNYLDTNTRGAQLSLDIGDELSNSENITDLEKAVDWLQATQKWVEDFKDSEVKMQKVSFRVGSKLKSDGTIPSYEKAYKYFTLAGNFSNAAQEVQLYKFYERVMKLSDEAKSTSGNTLSTSSNAVANTLTTKAEPRTMENPFSQKIMVKAESSDFNIFNPKSDVVYIGAIIDGDSVADETFKPILADRAPMDITIDLANIKGNATVTIPNPAKYSNAQQAIKQLVNQGTSDTIPVRAKFRSVEVKSSEMMNIALGVGVGKNGFSIQSNTKIDTSSSRSSTLIELTQIYYTVNIDIPGRPVNFFASTGSNIVSPNLLDKVSPYYVSSVTYGRRGYFLIQSDQSSKAIEEAIKVQKEALELNPAGVSVKVDTDIKNSMSKSHTTITSEVLGGSGKNANITNLQGMMQWIHDGMDASSNLGTAVPIGFVMRSLKDNGIAVVEQAGTISQPAKAKITVIPVAFSVDYGNNAKSLVRVYMSGGMQKPTGKYTDDPNITNDGKGWVVGINNGNNALPVGDEGEGKHYGLNAKSYETAVVSGDQRIYLGANFGDRMEVTVLGVSKGKNEWAGYKGRYITVNDIINQTDNYHQLTDPDKGWVFKGADFQGRYFFKFKVELLD